METLKKKSKYPKKSLRDVLENFLRTTENVDRAVINRNSQTYIESVLLKNLNWGCAREQWDGTEARLSDEIAELRRSENEEE